MTRDRKWVVISALIVGGIWAWRRSHEGADKVMPLPDFLTAWGATFFTLAVVGEAWPQLANAFAIAIGGADLLVNAPRMLPADALKTAGVKKPPTSAHPDTVKGSH